MSTTEVPPMMLALELTASLAIALPERRLEDAKHCVSNSPYSHRGICSVAFPEHLKAIIG